MGRIGYGYGSEWQLLRMLGRHRNDFNDFIKKILLEREIITDSKLDIEWLDFCYKRAKDEELSGNDILMRKELSKKHPKVLCKSKWDSVGVIDNKLLLIEAKGRLREFVKENKAKAGKKSLDEYKSLLEKIHIEYQIDSNEYMQAWVRDAYQMGNRIAMHFYLMTLGIESYLVYVFFLNDWTFNYFNESYCSNKDSVKNEDIWVDAMYKKLSQLGFDSEEKVNSIIKKMLFVFPNCDDQNTAI